jgi:hypothetical protein
MGERNRGKETGKKKQGKRNREKETGKKNRGEILPPFLLKTQNFYALTVWDCAL